MSRIDTLRKELAGLYSNQSRSATYWLMQAELHLREGREKACWFILLNLESKK
jgi:hypothetical protein